MATTNTFKETLQIMGFRDLQERIEQWVVKIDKLDFDINATRGLIMARSLTELELDRFMENILLRDKLNNELVEMRNERSRRQSP
ncbi:unnamed protein product [Rotaria magnacalcarata]|uniref:Uncharacterized protein n=1 Tax=Rotaria magnacalcarata TaxID=392030 RepID=A0A818W2D1_9BILA|nr:unnamed protein product [Rotaria magnacalcarata]CAF3792664.1 unnamed protein product [Rotaria magnacalcarata]CAF3870106.1 unnamed protein product [Rotaria magnacalcarata]